MAEENTASRSFHYVANLHDFIEKQEETKQCVNNNK